MQLASRLYFVNSVAELYQVDDGIAHLVWRAGARALPDFQTALETLLRLVRELGTGKALIDQRHMAPLSAAEQAWVAEHWLPRAALQGQYRYAAVLPAHDPATRQASAQVREHRSSLVRRPLYADFAEEAAAAQWLRRQVVIRSHV